ncbi:hypothetical protein [Synechococcus sp. PCC 7336]|uniref:hypothetical protein n=1 Tax=Synechococcus sp. PCC 7336 TaxID=195250 RepID=UPI000345CE28|nr:hypothetical protein [Synechococcus sp. PCC 7336]
MKDRHSCLPVKPSLARLFLKASQASGYFLQCSAIALLGIATWGGWGARVAARPILSVNMRLGRSLHPDYWYVVALGNSTNIPQVNLLNPNLQIDPGEVSFVDNWDYLIRVKPLNTSGLVDSSIQVEGDVEREFVTGFNEVVVLGGERPLDTLSIEVDLAQLDRLDPDRQAIHVSLFTIPNPFELDPEFTLLAIDATRGESPNAYALSLADRRRVTVDNPQRQETVRRSRELIAEQENLTSQLLERRALSILSANIVTFELELEDR